MSYRIVMRPDKSLGVFNDVTDTWVDQALGDEDAVDLLHDAEGIEPDEIREAIRQLRRSRIRDEHDRYVMTWAEAEWRTCGRHGNQPLERDAKGKRILTHGTGGWRRGCRCDVCTEVHLEDNRKRYGAADRGFTHGYSGYAQGCRCEVCSDAKAEYRRNARAERTGNPDPPPVPHGGDVRTEQLGARYTAREYALVERLAAKDDVPAGRFIRDAILAVLTARTGYQPTARPEAAPPARRGKPARPRGDARSVISRDRYTPREKALIEQLAKEDGLPVSQWLREPVLAILEERAGYMDMARRNAPRRRNYSRP